LASMPAASCCCPIVRVPAMSIGCAGSVRVAGSEVAERRAIVDAQRDELLRWRDAGRLPEASLRVLERELDHTEHTLRGR